MKLDYEHFERVAMTFVLESETWPVFVAWVMTQPHSEEMHAAINDDNLLPTLRVLWMAHSPDMRLQQEAVRRLLERDFR